MILSTCELWCYEGLQLLNLISSVL